MVRVKTTVARKKRAKRLLKSAKGFRGGRSKQYRHAKDTVKRGLAYSYRDRKVKKREFRALWIARINAGCRQHGTTYRTFIAGLKKQKIDLDRKILADLAVNNKMVFKQLIEIAKS